MARLTTTVLLGAILMVLGSTEGFNPASFHRTAYEKRGDEEPDVEDDITQDTYPVQMPQCLAVGGVCTSALNCPIGQFLDLETLESSPCGDQKGVICCKPTLVTHEEVLQMDACYQKGAICTRPSLCPEQAQLDNPLLCGDQTDVTCCRMKLSKKDSVDFKSEAKNELHVQNSKRFPDVERRSVAIDKRKDILNMKKSAPFKLTSLGVAKRTEPTCTEAKGVCIKVEKCPDGDIVADQKFCSGDESIVCCRLSPATIGEHIFRNSVSYPDGGTDPEDIIPI